MFSGGTLGSMTVTPACKLAATTLGALAVTPACNLGGTFVANSLSVTAGGALSATSNPCPAGFFCPWGATSATSQCSSGFYCPVATGSTTFTGSISGTLLSVSGTPSGPIALNSLVSGDCVSANTIVTAIGSVTATGAITGTALSISAAGAGALANGMTLVLGSGSGVVAATVSGLSTSPCSAYPCTGTVSASQTVT